MTATTATHEVMISARSRNLGYGWTNSPRQLPGVTAMGWIIPAPSVPAVQGSLAAVEREMDSARRGNAGNEWEDALFVAGRRVVSARLVGERWALEHVYLYSELQAAGPGTFVATSVREIVAALRDGATIEVRLAGEAEASHG